MRFVGRVDPTAVNSLAGRCGCASLTAGRPEALEKVTPPIYQVIGL